MSHVSREIKQLFMEWQKCKKVGYIEYKKPPRALIKFKNKLNRKFKCCLFKFKPRSNLRKCNNNNNNLMNKNEDEFSETESNITNCDDADFKVKICEKKSPKIKLNVLSSKVSSALDQCKVSTRSAVHIIASTAEILGCNLENVSLSRETARRKRKENRTKIYNEILTSFSSQRPLTVHWDGKILEDSQQKVERLAVHVTGLSCSHI